LLHPNGQQTRHLNKPNRPDHLRYVYIRYPEYTTASEIVAKVLGKPAPKLTD
jgi:hypothetical protein